MNYTENEILALEYYSSRKDNDFLKTLGYKRVNSFINYLHADNRQNNEIPGSMFMNSSSLKELLIDIVDLFILSCKYGYTHNLPSRLYRGDNGGYRIESDAISNGKDAYWNIDQFLSCTKSIGETRVFSKPEDGGQLITIEIPSNIKIPFIDVNDILPASQFYSDEREILFPPYFYAKIISSDQNYKTIELGNEFIVSNDCPTLGENFFDDFINLSKNNNSKETNIQLGEYRKQLNSFLINQLDWINTIFVKYSYGFIDEEDLNNELNLLREYIVDVGEKENKMI